MDIRKFFKPIVSVSVSEAINPTPINPSEAVHKQSNLAKQSKASNKRSSLTKKDLSKNKYNEYRISYIENEYEGYRQSSYQSYKQKKFKEFLPEDMYNEYKNEYNLRAYEDKF
jgi:hypothetical protein